MALRRPTYANRRGATAGGEVTGPLNYDNMVPGIKPPTSQVIPQQGVASSAAIKFDSETSYYAGGGVLVRF